MKYSTDCEFIEGYNKPLFGKERHFIDLISIAIVAEDGRTYQALCSEYDFSKANQWVYKNVLLPLYVNTVSGDMRNHVPIESFHRVYGKPKDQIAKEIIDFILEKEVADTTIGIYGEKNIWDIKSHIEFIGWYSDYDWVLICSLFGTMNKLPKGFPQYCIDLKQTFDEKAKELQDSGLLGYKPTFKKCCDYIQSLPNYPINEKEHLAIEDAKWNFKLKKFLNNLEFKPVLVLEKDEFKNTIMDNIIADFIQLIVSSKQLPISLGINFVTEQKLFVHAIIEDDDEGAEDSIFMAEAKVNGQHAHTSLSIDVLVTEKSDKVKIPDYYKIIKLKE